MNDNQQYSIDALVWVIRGNAVESGKVAGFRGDHYRVAVEGGAAVESFVLNDVFASEYAACQFAAHRLEAAAKRLRDQAASCWIG